MTCGWYLRVRCVGLGLFGIRYRIRIVEAWWSVEKHAWVCVFVQYHPSYTGGGGRSLEELAGRRKA